MEQGAIHIGSSLLTDRVPNSSQATQGTNDASATAHCPPVLPNKVSTCICLLQEAKAAGRQVWIRVVGSLSLTDNMSGSSQAMQGTDDA